MQPRFSIPAMRTEGKQLLPSLFLTKKWSFKCMFRCPRTLSPQSHDQNPAERNRRVWGRRELVVPSMNWEFVISLKTGRLGALQPLSALRTPVNHQPLAAGLYRHLQEIFGSRNYRNYYSSWS